MKAKKNRIVYFLYFNALLIIYLMYAIILDIMPSSYDTMPKPPRLSDEIYYIRTDGGAWGSHIIVHLICIIYFIVGTILLSISTYRKITKKENQLQITNHLLIIGYAIILYIFATIYYSDIFALKEHRGTVTTLHGPV
ncbi:MAG: hypothetical protein COA45_09405 [Zetaproteobacteria bacterium]|nr:MAG: hypothetical protein COA45_09405 [Zetaproteobacteria bacterium]